MNKALVTAMLLGLAAADQEDEAAFEALRAKRAEKQPNAEDCEDAATATARAAKARAEGEKALLDTEKQRLDALLVDEKAIYEKMKGADVDPAAGTSNYAKTLTNDARNYLDVAQAAWDIADAAKTENDGIIQSETAGTIADLTEVKTVANQAVVDKNAEITALKEQIVDLAAAVTQHEAEKVTLTAAYDAKVKSNQETYTDVRTTKMAELVVLKKQQTNAALLGDGNANPDYDNTYGDGTLEVKAAKDLLKTSANTAVTNFVSNAKTEATLFTEFKVENSKAVKYAVYVAAQTAACSGVTDTCTTAGDYVKTLLPAEIWNTADYTGESAYTTAKNAHDTALTGADGLADLQAKLIIATKNYDVATAADTAKLSAISTHETDIGVKKGPEVDGDGNPVTPDPAASTGLYLSEEQAAATLVTTEEAAKTKITAQAKAADDEKKAADARLATLEAELAPLEVALANAETALTDGKKAKEAAEKLKAAAEVEIDRLDPFLVEAKKAGTRAAAYFKFYNDFTVDAKARVDATQAAIDAITDVEGDGKSAGKFELADAKIAAAELDVQAAITRCKRRQYSDAIAALTKFNEDEATRATKASEAKTSYDDKRKKAIAKNADCRKNADGVRAECAEGECCGQANRYDRDGTRMTIEVCGSAEDSTYTYWPVMKEGMVKQPATEQWRYYCILGAKNLVAGATAVVGALYLAQ